MTCGADVPSRRECCADCGGTTDDAGLSVVKWAHKASKGASAFWMNAMGFDALRTFAASEPSIPISEDVRLAAEVLEGANSRLSSELGSPMMRGSSYETIGAKPAGSAGRSPPRASTPAITPGHVDPNRHYVIRDKPLFDLPGFPGDFDKSANCCCVAVGLTIAASKKKPENRPGPGGKNILFYPADFVVKFKTAIKGDPNGVMTQPCTSEWWEYTNSTKMTIPLGGVRLPRPAGEWFPLGDALPEIQEHFSKMPCSAGEQTKERTDRSALASTEGDRTPEVWIIVKLHSGCPGGGTKTAYAYHGLASGPYGIPMQSIWPPMDEGWIPGLEPPTPGVPVGPDPPFAGPGSEFGDKKPIPKKPEGAA